MKYYSEKLKKIYDTEADVEEAEKQFDLAKVEEDKKKNERKARYQQVMDAYKKVDEEKKKADELLSKFIKDYGGFHTTITSTPVTINLSEIFDELFRFPF